MDEELTQGISTTEIIQTRTSSASFDTNTLQTYVKGWSRHFDPRYGANKGAPKFPMPGSLQFLLDFAEISENEKVKNHLKLTLEKIQKGGIYDHLGGGFFRYSVDEQWFVPHFEKMLYDNAQLASLYTQAYKHFKDENYRTVVYQTIDFMRRELRSAEGGFFSAIDADSEGEEGKFYTFTKAEIDNILGPDSELFSVIYGVTASGVLHGKNVLRIASSLNETACLFGLSIEEVIERLKNAKIKLFNSRLTRVRPITDDKIILSWNALVVNALVNAYLVFGDKRFLTDAISTITFIEENLFDKKSNLLRVHCKGKSNIPAFLDDYAFLTQAYILLYQATFDQIWLAKAKNVVDKTIENFYDINSGMFFYSSSGHDNIIVRKMEITDGVIPSSSAVMAENLSILGIYFRDEEYTSMANQMLQNIIGHLQQGGPYIYKWAQVILKNLTKPAELAATGKNAKENLKIVISNSTYPNLIPYLYKVDSKLPISNYPVEDGKLKLCLGQSCMEPANSYNEILSILNEERPFGTKPQDLS
jgi:uncharacterized protein